MDTQSENRADTQLCVSHALSEVSSVKLPNHHILKLELAWQMSTFVGTERNKTGVLKLHPLE